MSHRIVRCAASLFLALAFSLAGILPASAAPPSNDNFANAMVISSLPFDDWNNTVEATLESDEPVPNCGFSSIESTIWYVFTPSTNGSVTASIPSSGYLTILAAYSGSSLNSLSEIGCSNFNSSLTFAMTAGTTYYIQVGDLYDSGGGTLSFHLQAAASPVAGFNYYPADPSIFDTLQFADNSYDPAGIGIKTYSWDLGDGSTSTAPNVAHQYASDGDFTVHLQVATFDGRTASVTQTVPVRTHDVSIIKITTPQVAKSGQTWKITVDVKSLRYRDPVRVDLYKSAPGGSQLVGSLTQQVPLKPGGLTTHYTFSYTFNAGDAALGKVTFRAVATITTARDAIPSDNEVISSPPTQVKK